MAKQICLNMRDKAIPWKTQGLNHKHFYETQMKHAGY